MWRDADRGVWLWCPVEGREPVGIVEVHVCPHCHGLLPLMESPEESEARFKRIWEGIKDKLCGETLADPDE